MPPLAPSLDRRRLLQGASALGTAGLFGLEGCAAAGQSLAPSPLARGYTPLQPIRVARDRIFDVTVCLRPFRAAGPRLDTEEIGDAFVVHNYGHGGSGWSLSWGSGTVAVRKAMSKSPRRIAVVGCGALGLTAATLAQRAGAEVTIYAKELLPQARSARATGSWTPDSRIALESVAGPAFAALWEEMARTSFKAYRNYLGLPGDPVRWSDRYSVHDAPRPDNAPPPPPPPGMLDFGEYSDRIRDLTPRWETLAEGSTPFDAPVVRRSSSMQFNIADYGHTLMSDFLQAGGKIERREFKTPADLAALPDKVVINCPGYGGRALFKDESIVPVRGQIQWLIPQAEVTYGVNYGNVNLLSRTDGIVVQTFEGGDMDGYKNDDETPDMAEVDRAVARAAELYARHWRA